MRPYVKTTKIREFGSGGLFSGENSPFLLVE